METWSRLGNFSQAPMNLSYVKGVAWTLLNYFSGVRPLCLTGIFGGMLNTSPWTSMSWVASFTTSEEFGPLTSCLLTLCMNCNMWLCGPDLWYVSFNLVMVSNIKDNTRWVSELERILFISIVISVWQIVTSSNVIWVLVSSHRGINAKSNPHLRPIEDL